MSDDAELTRLREALEQIMEKSRRSHDSWRPGREFASETGRSWHEGFVTALSSCLLIAHAALDPEGAAQADKEWLAANGTDKEWHALTGNCGHCGNVAGDCVCPEDDPCGCGPHEPRTWPVKCWRCDGTGVVNPVKGRGVHADQGVLEL